MNLILKNSIENFNWKMQLKNSIKKFNRKILNRKFNWKIHGYSIGNFATKFKVKITIAISKLQLRFRNFRWIYQMNI